MKAEFFALSLIVGTLSTLSVFAQGGGSVNGPDLKGNMIPVFSDGEIPVEKAETALTVCYKRLASQILEGILGRPVALGNTEWNGVVAYLAQPQGSSGPIPAGYNLVYAKYLTSDEKSPEIRIRDSDSTRIKPLYADDRYRYFLNFSHDYFIPGKDSGLAFGYGFESVDSQTKNDRQQISLTAFHFPFMIYQLKDKSIYGELGELTKKQVFVGNLRFIFSPDHSDTVFTLYATRADGQKLATPITVDAKNLINCIKTNLAN